MAGFYDYGPLGAELKKNVKDAWWKNFVTSREDVVGLDSSIIHNPATWQSSGESICDPLFFILFRTPPLRTPLIFVKK
jgi:glycyl-tRNA synthetase